MREVEVRQGGSWLKSRGLSFLFIELPSGDGDSDHVCTLSERKAYASAETDSCQASMCRY
jgi:hypothetical protein